MGNDGLRTNTDDWYWKIDNNTKGVTKTIIIIKLFKNQLFRLLKSLLK